MLDIASFDTKNGATLVYFLTSLAYLYVYEIHSVNNGKNLLVTQLGTDFKLEWTQRPIEARLEVT
jgi:hypothetical protein